MKEETFGPVIAAMKVSSFDQAPLPIAAMVLNLAPGGTATPMATENGKRQTGNITRRQS